MSRFSGPQGKGALRAYREIKHAEAAQRQQTAPLPPDNTFGRRAREGDLDPTIYTHLGYRRPVIGGPR